MDHGRHRRASIRRVLGVGNSDLVHQWRRQSFQVVRRDIEGQISRKPGHEFSASINYGRLVGFSLLIERFRIGAVSGKKDIEWSSIADLGKEISRGPEGEVSANAGLLFKSGA